MDFSKNRPDFEKMGWFSKKGVVFEKMGWFSGKRADFVENGQISSKTGVPEALPSGVSGSGSTSRVFLYTLVH